jgi:hypothetical protein
MRRSPFCSFVWLTLLVAAGSVLLAACGEDETTPITPTATVDASANPTGTVELEIGTPSFPTDAVFGREPVEEAGGAAPPVPVLTDVQTGTRDDFDRVLFQLDGGLPGYRVEYVSPPITACGSGLPVEIAGDAFLQVRMSPAAAHDDAGTATFDQQELAPDLPGLLEMEQTCDFEAVLVWVMGLAEEVDFRVFDLSGAFLIVDVQHP